MALHAGFRVWLHETHSTAAIASLKQVVSFEAKPSRLVDSKLQLASHRLEAIVWRQHNLVEARGGLPAGQDQAKDIAMLVARGRRKSQTHMSERDGVCVARTHLWQSIFAPRHTNDAKALDALRALELAEPPLSPPSRVLVSAVFMCKCSKADFTWCSYSRSVPVEVRRCR